MLSVVKKVKTAHAILLFVEKYHIYVADALQIVSAKNQGVDHLLSGNRRLVDASREEGVDSDYLG